MFQRIKQLFGTPQIAFDGIRLIVSDMDGTLVNSEGNIYASTVELLQSLSAKKVEFMIATGRSHASVMDVYDLIGIHSAAISFDGALLSSEAVQPLYQCGIESEALTILNTFAEEYPFIGFSSITPTLIYHYQTEYLPSYLHDENIRRHTATKAEVFQGTPLRLYAAGQRVAIQAYSEKIKNSDLCRDLMVQVFESRRESGIWYAEIRNKKASKGAALSWYLQQRNIPLDSVAVIGDYRNDLSLFELGAYNVTPANAVAELRAKAHFITEHSAEDGGIDEFLSLVCKAIH